MRHLAEQVAGLHQRRPRSRGGRSGWRWRWRRARGSRRTARRRCRPRGTARRRGRAGARGRRRRSVRSTSCDASAKNSVRGEEVFVSHVQANGTTLARRAARPQLRSCGPSSSPAAAGPRFGRPKQYEPLGAGGSLDRSVAAAREPSDGVVVVVPAGATPTRRGRRRRRRDAQRVGARRARRRADGRRRSSCVHDAARPFAVAAAVRGGHRRRARPAPTAPCPALPVTDTIKRVDADGAVVETPDRGDAGRRADAAGVPRRRAARRPRRRRRRHRRRRARRGCRAAGSSSCRASRTTARSPIPTTSRGHARVGRTRSGR